MEENTSGVYWAAQQGEELGAAIVQRFKEFETDLSGSDELKRMRLSYQAYYCEDEAGHWGVEQSELGKSKQLRGLKSNHFRANLQNRLAMAWADLPGFVPVAKNTDSRSAKQVLLAKGALGFAMDEGGVEQEVKDAVEAASVLGWAWACVGWNRRAGKTLTSATGEGVEYEGDAEVRLRLPPDVAFHLRGRTKRPRWVIIREWHNKFDVAAEVEAQPAETPEDAKRFAEQAEQIRALAATVTSSTDIFQGAWGTSAREIDEIAVLELRHARTPALPNGRCERILFDLPEVRLHVERADGQPAGALPYEDLCCYMVQESSRIGRSHGYAQAPDTLNLQKAVDVLASIPYSGARTFGGIYIWAPFGVELTAEQLTEAVTVLRGGQNSPQGKPEALQFVRPNDELRNQRSGFISEMSQLQGMDDLSMGRDTRVLSGAAMALLESRTQRALSPLHKAGVAAIKQVANALIGVYKLFAATTRSIPMKLGKSKKSIMKEFSRESIADIDRIEIETVSPLMRQPSGRLELARMLMGLKDATGRPALNAEQLLAVVETGKYEPLTEGPMSQLMTIRDENELLSAGEMLDEPPPPPPPLDAMGNPLPVPPPPPPRVATALVTDPHHLHIPEHAVVLASLEARADPNVVANTLAHIQRHIELRKTADPDLLQDLGVPPPPSAMMAMQPPGAPPAEGPAGGPAAGPPKDAPAAGAPPSGPSMPTNPSTGEKYSPTAEVSNA